MTRRRTSYHGRRGNNRHRHSVRPRGHWNPWGVALLLFVVALIVASHYGIHVHITR